MAVQRGEESYWERASGPQALRLMCFVHWLFFQGPVEWHLSSLFTPSYQLLPWKCFLLKLQRSQIPYPLASYPKWQTHDYFESLKKGSKCFSLHQPPGYCLQRSLGTNTLKEAPQAVPDWLFNCLLIGEDVQAAAGLLCLNNRSTGDVHQNCLRRVKCETRDDCGFKRNVNGKKSQEPHSFQGVSLKEP